MRLVEKGYRVLVLERGRRYREADLPGSDWDLPRHLTPAGRLEIISWSPGSASQAELVGQVRRALPDHRLPRSE